MAPETADIHRPPVVAWTIDITIASLAADFEMTLGNSTGNRNHHGLYQQHTGDRRPTEEVIRIMHFSRVKDESDERFSMLNNLQVELIYE